MSTQSQQGLQQYAKPIQISPTKNDIGAPFSFQEWFSIHQGIIPGQEYLQYNEYLINWFKNKNLTTIDEKTQLRINYLSLLRQLQLFFTQEETENWYNKVDITNDKELLLAIPYFAKKLKEIALYYIQLRKNIKEARLRYNQVGTGIGVTDQLEKLILSIYSQKNNKSTTIPYQIWKNVPALSALNTNLNLQIEELYDNQNYFDLSPSLPVSAYFDTTSVELEKFLTTRGLYLTSSNWIYGLGIYPLSGDDMFNLNELLNRKYLGQSKFTTETTATTSIAQDIYTVNINLGNNFFLWPGTPFTVKAETLPRYKPIALNDIQELLTFGTGGSSIETSDTIFVKTGKGVQGAWLSRDLYTNINTAMTASLEPFNKVAFRYPFPGYGLSGEGTAWTGFSLNTTPQYFYLDQKFKNSVSQEYWTAAIELTSTPSLKINDSTLINNGAYASARYELADKVRTLPDWPSYDSTNIAQNLNEAWLYKFTETDISINNGKNIIIWPYKKINSEEEFPAFIPENLTETCTTMPVSSINFAFAVAGNSLETADTIYKLVNYQDDITQAVECCWLSGFNQAYPSTNINTVLQPSFQGLFNSGEFTPFVWTGPDNTDIEQVFKSVDHQKDCKYITTPGSTYNNYNLCTCKQTNFTPFGHPGNNFTDNSSFCDFIYEVDGEPQKPNLQKAQEFKFAWYKTKSKIEWGSGQWRSNRSENNNKFYFKTGKLYYYYRAAIRTKNKEDVTLPSLVVRYNFNTYYADYNKNFVWVKALKNNNDTWYSTNESSSMVFAPGDILFYSKTSTQTSYVTSTVPLTSYISENRGSLWSNYDYLTLGPQPNGLPQQFILTLPSSITYTATNRPAQIPPNLSNVVRVSAWEIKDPNGNITRILNTPTAIVTPTVIGTYSVSVRLLTSATIPPPTTITTGANPSVSFSTVAVTFTGIPDITVISPLTTAPSLTGYNIDLPPYVLKTPLQGWNYNLNRFDIKPGRNRGGKPFWAKTYTEKTKETDFKGMYFTGNTFQVVDNYNLIYQPEFSDIIFSTGSYIEYDRRYPTRLNWLQPLLLTSYSQKKQWNTIEFETSAASNLNSLLGTNIFELITTPTNSSSNIVLQNYVNNKPVEIYYNALSPFFWNISAVAENTNINYTTLSTYEIIKPVTPWAHFSNQHYPSVAAYPAIQNLYPAKKTGGFFTPQYLGASVFVDYNYTVNTVYSSAALGTFFEDRNKTVKGRGLSLTDPLTPYTVKYNSIWQKEPLFVGPITGIVNKTIFKKYQKLIPYQSTYETNPNTNIGIILPNSRQTPWTGPEDSDWGDLANFPVSPTGELNIEQWENSQVLKNQKNLQLDCWSTDIFGNQYGLYKNYKNAKPSERINIPGQLWVRNNAQFVAPGVISLSGVFDSYINTSLYNELTGSGIYKIDLFYDTLLIETKNVLIFEKLIYDFNTDTIFSITDNARFIVLSTPSTTNIGAVFNNNLSFKPTAKPGDTWFFPKSKQVYISVGELRYDVNKFIKPTIFWEYKYNTVSSLSTLVLSGDILIPNDPESYIVTVDGLIQPRTTYNINSNSQTLTFNTPLTASNNVFVLLPYNPYFEQDYDSPARQYIISSPIDQVTFPIPNFDNPTTNKSQYVVSIDGVPLLPSNLPNSPYTLYTDGTPRIVFTQPVSANQVITINRLPKYKICSTSEFYSWFETFSTPQTSVSLLVGPEIIPTNSESYLININNTLLPPSSYTVDSVNRRILFNHPIASSSHICITQLSVPQVSKLIPGLYQLDLNTQNIKRVFPINDSQITAYDSLSTQNIIEFDRPLLSYNDVNGKFVYTITGKKCDGDYIIIETRIKNINTEDLPILEIEDITAYVAAPYIEERQLPPLLTSNLLITVTSTNLSSVQFTCTTENGSATFVPVDMPSWISLSTTGVFNLNLPQPSNIYHATFYAYNNYGRVYNSLTVNISV